MTNAESRLHASLRREHLEEASFLFEQRCQWLEDPQLELADVAALEERLEAHLDALVIGAAPAHDRCLAAVVDGDAGEVHAAVRVCCRALRPEVLTSLEHRLESRRSDRDTIRSAAAIALDIEAPAQWCTDDAELLHRPNLGSVLARAAVFRGIDVGARLLLDLADDDDGAHECALWALGELRHAPARDTLRRLAASGEPSIARAAAIAALKLGERSSISAITNIDPIARVLVDDGPAQWLVTAALAAPTPDHLLALGLSGDSRGLGLLTELLGEPATAPSAAAGLLVATGAALLEPEPEPDFAALLPDDDHDGPPSSPARLRLCRDPDVWRSWLGDHDTTLPRRMGEPRSARATVRAIATLALPVSVREYLCDELAIRWGNRIPLRPHLPAAHQLAVLAGHLPNPRVEARA